MAMDCHTSCPVVRRKPEKVLPISGNPFVTYEEITRGWFPVF